MRAVDHFTVVESVYGRFIVNRHCHGQAETLLKTGRTHIEPELDCIRSILSVLQEGAVMIDGGANIGLVAVPCALALREKKGIVHAFEPQRMLFNALSGTVALNGLDNLMTYDVALGAQAGTAYVPPVDYAQTADFGMVQLSPVAVAQGSAVKVVTVDMLNLKRLDFLKLDVEGFEVQALAGARQTLLAHRPVCWIEYWKAGEANIAACFRALDYKFYRAGELNMLCVPQSRAESKLLNVAFPEIYPV